MSVRFGLGIVCFLSACYLKKINEKKPGKKNKPVRCLGGFDSLVKCHLCWPIVATTQASCGYLLIYFLSIWDVVDKSFINPVQESPDAAKQRPKSRVAPAFPR